MRRLLPVLVAALLIGSVGAMSLSVVQPAQAASDYRFTELDGPSSVTQGETVTLSGTVVNVGDTEGNKVVQFYVDGEVVNRERINLEPNERQTITVEYQAPQDTEGTVYYGLTSNGNSLYDSLTVNPDMMMTENETMEEEDEQMMNNNSGDDNNSNNDGRLDPQLAFIMIVIILLVVGGYVAYEIISGP